MEFQTLIVDQDASGVARIRLNRPEVHNAFDAAMIIELRDVALKLADDDDVRVVVLSGEGRSFSSGADLHWMKEAAAFTPEENRMDASRLSNMLHALDTMPKPLITLIHGSAFGGGVGLAAVADIAIAVRDTRFALSEVRLGLTPATIAPYVIAAIGAGNARSYFLSGKSFDGEEARRIGLVHQVAENAEELEILAEEWINNILSAAPGAVADAKKLVATISGRELTARLMEETSEMIAARRASVEGREGMAAFLEKRKPAWFKKT